MISTLCQFVALVSTGLAAYFWWKSSQISAPREFGISRFGDEQNPHPDTPEQRWAREVSAANALGAIWATVAFGAQFIGLASDVVMKWTMAK